VKPFIYPKDIYGNITNLSNSTLNSSNVSPKILLTYLYGVGVSHVTYSDLFDYKVILDRLTDRAQLIESSETKNLSKTPPKVNVLDFDFVGDKTYTFFYKDNIVKMSLYEEEGFDNNKKEKCSLSIYTPIGMTSVEEEFLPYLNNTSGPKVFILTQQYGDPTFQKFTLSLPQTFDLDYNYGKGFKDISKKIVDSLNKNHSGLYMFHGPPGTGKSTYIKYLASNLKKEVIFFPTNLVQNIVSPDIISLLISKQNCVLVLEDAEKAIIKRESNSEASLVSTLLNMTDGILGDVLKLNVIVTYNCKRTEIDEALLRKGRLKAEHTFSHLSEEEATRLIKKLKLDMTIEGSTSIADIFNYKNDKDLIGNRESLTDKKPAIGFGAF